jgi:tRNA/tmRNA/rRNA uracil-C5-methylase (TrmA/RlmC/RlmD family)
VSGGQRRDGRRGRQVRERAQRGRSRVGERFTAVVGPVAHGGHFVARVPVDPADPSVTRVVFTRHALPGETVVLQVTEGGESDRFWRADAVEVLEASPDRVVAPCPVAGPGLCGGCDFQHVALPRQRALKAEVVTEQLRRLAGLDVGDLSPAVGPAGLAVEPVPGDDDGLRWRTRARFAEGPGGVVGMRAHRSRRVVPTPECLIAAPGARVALTAGSTDSDTVVAGEGPATADEPPVVEVVEAAGARHEFAVAADGFWQVHPGAPAVLVDTVLEMLAPRPGERALDLYAGVGLFARFLADAVGDPGRVVAVEGDRAAVGHGTRNLAGALTARMVAGRVDRVLAEQLDEPFDLVVLDPPREGARRTVVEQVVDRAPRAVAYVACDPAALARDVGTFAEHGYRLTALRAFDAFPMTHHVECVALLEKTRISTSIRQGLTHARSPRGC